MAELSPGPGVAIWRRIAETVGAEIASGTFAQGDKLPTEAALSRRFGVNRHTVRRAVRDLAERGLVRVEQGRGMFAAEDVIEYPIGDRPRFTEIVDAQRRTPGGRLLHAAELPAEEPVAGNLELDPGAPILAIERLAEADGRPISIGSHYFSAARFPNLIAYYLEEGSIARSLARSGLDDFLRVSTHVRARRATADEARMLHLPPSAPILETRAVNADPDGRPVEYGIGRFASNRVELLFET